MLQKSRGIDDKDSRVAKRIVTLAVRKTKLWDMQEWRSGRVFMGFERTYEDLKPSSSTAAISSSVCFERTYEDLKP